MTAPLIFDAPFFDTVLIANRGEIALRIMRTAKRLGYRTVAVFSDADSNAVHRHAADMAMHIGAAQPSASYLNIPAVIAAAKQAGAQAVHPGYGFLAENAEFATACAEAGLNFIGPSAQAMLAMGNKAGGKQLMQDAGVPCVPGYQGIDQSDGRMAAEAARIGYPVMIKAVAGGGGRGMRRVDVAENFLAALRSARSEAEHAFANADVLLEKAIIDPRHIEIQIFADAHGNVVHLGERDCSVQRRHQKLIEESPSPAVTPALRARMGEVSIAAAKVIAYVGAGTLEFLLDREGNFYFMEMNTRLQVEHAVTEAIIGVDLVEWQLRIATGEALPLNQAQVDARREQGGHAIEVRLCAEDPQLNFLPQSGRIALWSAPDHVRCDHALGSGMEVSPYYDSMLAKIVAHGRDRADALRRLGLALDDTVLLGVKTNRHFLARCIRHPEFAAGAATTAFIEQNFPANVRAAQSLSRRASQVAAFLLVWHRTNQAVQRFSAELQGWSSSATYAQGLSFVLDGSTQHAQIAATGRTTWQITLAGVTALISVVASEVTALHLQIEGNAARVKFACHADTVYFVLDGVEHTALDMTYAVAERSTSAGAGDSGRVTAPMNGRVVALPVLIGEQIKVGQIVMVIEAMKMEHSIVAGVAGKVLSLFAAIGDQVAPGQVLMEIEVVEGKQQS
ncbi:MAG: biotin carboxylase N-terminal domain-containing protein [Undibacterium sp.]|uniref:acetyl/propionyl/methylcrotonyl-CoA carboxylase subunit alpha n=1 Tax=Undibacterium sp. TaxID=1914977 RepID=UPI0027159E59|nr:biotin carboxylase N-terminal domain-containing protein [Undibacterium sp.]MDO8654685.1 biotin carboxylase N-terminal domain-containing protein [Undibacterium sp.]